MTMQNNISNLVKKIKVMISNKIRQKITAIVNVFETGTPQGHYGLLVKYRDHKDPKSGKYITQITYGRSQTTEFGNLKNLIRRYVDRGGRYASFFVPYINRIGKMPSLSKDLLFCEYLRRAGNEDPIMKEAQDALFDSYYFDPALGWFHQMGFKKPLSLLVIYDSHIHSGTILAFLRKRFPAFPPIKGGKEEDWTSQYVETRHHWLKTHSHPILRKTIYRTQCFRDQIKQGNWNLASPVRTQGVTIP